MRVTGTGGEVQAGGRRAAALGAWTLTGKPDAWEVSATATETDPYWLETAAVFRLTLHVGTRRWRYSGVRVAVDSGQAHITGTGKAEIV